MYNSVALRPTNVITIESAASGEESNRVLSGRGFIILVASLALIVSLASRTFQAALYQDHATHTPSVVAKIQHRDRDASAWVPPTPVLSLLFIAGPSTDFSAPERVYVRLHPKALYNRPPPA